MNDLEYLTPAIARGWAGIDVGKTHHWVCVVDDGGRVLLSRTVANDEQDLATIIAAVDRCAATVVWAIDIVGAPSALLLTMLAAGDRDVRYASGRMVNALSVAFTGEGKTDAKDAHVIANVARMRPDLPVVGPAADVVRDLALLTAHRADLTADRVRLINRLRDLLTSVFPALEREFSFKSHKGAVLLLTKYSTPAAIRRAGPARLTAWLKRRHVRDAAALATRAVSAANTQHITLPGHDLAAVIVSELATTLLALDERVHQWDQQLAARFHAHPQAAIIESMPGFGPVLGSMLIVAVGDFTTFADAGHLAAAAGLVPVPNDSGRRSGNLHKPRRYSRPLRHAFYLSAQTSTMREGPNQDYYAKKRAQGHTHTQATIALARRRIDVLWALLRDNRTYTATPPPLAKAA